MVETYFQSEVAESGYNWITSRTIPPSESGKKLDEFLTSDWSADIGRIRVRRYRPLAEHTGLFRTLAETEPNPGNIKEFADRFGLLLGGKAPSIVLPHRPHGKGHLIGQGEPISIWHNAVMKLRMAISLWEMARHGDMAKLRKHIVWHDDRVMYDSHPELKANERPAVPHLVTDVGIASEDIFQSMTRGDLIRPALTFVQSIINENLAKAAAPRLLWDEHHSDMSVDLVPKHLLGAIWLQFANAVVRNSELRKCIECGTWFAVSPTTARSDKLYCSTACRTKAYRRRQAEALRLHDKGIPLKEIAAKLEADPKAVHGWLTRSRRGNSARRTKKKNK